jgi:subtilase family serine protease
VPQNKSVTPPSSNSQWSLETALDVEWARAIAPAANILLVEALYRAAMSPVID